MVAALIVKEDGLTYAAEVPEEPKVDESRLWDTFYESGVIKRKKEYEAALASAKENAVLVSDQEKAKKIIWTNRTGLPFAEPITIKPGIYPIPDLDWEVIDNTYIHEGSGKYWEDEPVKMKRLLDLPETYAILKESTPCRACQIEKYNQQSDRAAELYASQFKKGDQADLQRKVDFYRAETSKLREYIEEKRIGLPNQKIFDALYDYIKELERVNAENGAVIDQHCNLIRTLESRERELEQSLQFKKGDQTEQRFTIEDMREAFRAGQDHEWVKNFGSIDRLKHTKFDEWIKTL